MSSSRTPSIVIAALVVTLGITACGNDTRPADPESSTAASQSAEPSTDSTTAAPPTPGTSTSAKPTDAATEPTTEPTVSLELVLPQLSYAGPGIAAGTFDISGFVPVVVEDEGECTFTLTSGSQTVTKKSTGLADASSTTCGQVTVAGSEISSGTWSVTLRYTSALYSGTSEPLELVIP